jgi:hypothetical protein
MNVLKKAFTLSVVLTTIVWTMGAAAFVPVAGAVTLSAGDLIKASGAATYYYAADGKRYTFPTLGTYGTWFANFDKVKKITDDELAAIDLAGNVVVRPGTKLVKITTVPKVFAVGLNGKLSHVASEAAAKTLYGDNWAKRVMDVPDGFWTNYTDSGVALDGTKYPSGTLVKKGTDTFYVNADGTWSKFTGTAFADNMFSVDNVVTAPSAMTYTAGADITAAVATKIDASQGGGAVVSTNNTLTVSLNSGSPAGSVIVTSTPNEFTRLNLTAGAKDVSVNSLKLTAGGLGTSTNIDDVTLYVAGVKVGTTGNISADGYRIFNFATPITVAAGTTKVLSVKATVAANGYYSLGVKAAADVLSSATSVLGSFPVVGGTMNATDSVTVGSITFDAENNDTTEYVGADNVTFVEFTAAAGSTEDVAFSTLTLKNNGNLKGSNAGSMSLYHDSTLLATASLDDNKYVTFNFDAVTIKKGETENFKVTGSIEAGDANDTVQLYVKDATDVTAKGLTYNSQVTVVSSAFDTDDADSTTITLAAGKLVMNFDNTAVPAANITKDTDNIVMAKLTLKAADEAVKITGLDFGMSGTGYAASDVENAELVNLATGGIIDLTATTYTTDEEILIPAGQTLSFNFRVDTTTSAANNDVYYVTLASSGVTAEGEVTGTAITSITPSSITSRNMTVVASALTHAVETLNAVTTMAGASDIIVYKSTVKASVSSDVTVSKVVVTTDDVANDGATAFTDTDITKADLYINNVLVKSSSNQIVENGTTFTNTLTFDGFNFIVPAGKTYTLSVKVSFASTLNSSGADGDFTMAMSSITAKDAANKTITVTPDTTVGPVVTPHTSGLFDVYGSNTETGANRDLYVVGGTQSGLIGALKFDAQREDVKVKTLVLKVNGNDTAANDLSNVLLIDSNGTTVLASSNDFSVSGGNTLVTFTDWNYVVAESGMKKVFVAVTTDQIGNAAEQTGTAGTDLNLMINSVTAEGNQSGNTITVTGANTPSVDSNSNFDNDYVTKDATNVGLNVTGLTSGLSNGVLINGQTVIGKFNIAISTGSNVTSGGEESKLVLDELTFTFNQSGITTVTAGDEINIYLASDPNNKVGFAYDDGGELVAALTGLVAISANDTLVVEAANMTGAGDAGDYVQVKLDWGTTAANFSWDDSISGPPYEGLRLPYSSVVSGTLSN